MSICFTSSFCFYLLVRNVIHVVLFSFSVDTFYLVLSGACVVKNRLLVIFLVIVLAGEVNWASWCSMAWGKCPTTSLFLPSYCPGLENVTSHCVCVPLY